MTREVIGWEVVRPSGASRIYKTFEAALANRRRRDAVVQVFAGDLIGGNA